MEPISVAHACHLAKKTAPMKVLGRNVRGPRDAPQVALPKHPEAQGRADGDGGRDPVPRFAEVADDAVFQGPGSALGRRFYSVSRGVFIVIVAASCRRRRRPEAPWHGELFGLGNWRSGGSRETVASRCGTRAAPKCTGKDRAYKHSAQWGISLNEGMAPHDRQRRATAALKLPLLS